LAAIAIGLFGFGATGCQNLTVPGSIDSQDSTSSPGLDDPNQPGAGDQNVIPLREAGFELEDPSR